VIRVLIADEIARIVGDLEKLQPHAEAVEVCGVAHQASALFEEAWLRQPDVLLLHEGFTDLPPADFIAHLGSVSPATRVLLMTSGATGESDTWTAGVVSDSAGGALLVEAIHRAAGIEPPHGADFAGSPEDGVAPPPRSLRTPRGRGTVIVAFSGKGGTGTSMIAANLAVVLAGGADGRAVLLDTDLQFGDAAAMLHVEHHPLTIADLAPHGEAIDGALLDDVLATGPGEVRVLRAPSSPEFAETVGVSHLRAIIRASAKAHEFVVVDTPSILDERVLEAFELADRLLLVTSYNLSAVRGTKATLLLLDALGVERERVGVVLNHTRPHVNYRRDDIEEILGRRVLVDLAYDPRTDASVDSGSPIVLAQPRAELSRSLIALADQLAARAGDADTAGTEIPVIQPSPSYRRRFSLGRR
jgi:pilus assembly protein CpaE